MDNDPTQQIIADLGEALGTPESPEAESAEAADPQADATDDTQAAEQSSIEAPENWADGLKNLFNSLDDEGKQIFLDEYKNMEGGYTKKLQEVSDIKKEWEGINNALSPVDGVIKSAGISRTDAVAEMGRVLHNLHTNPGGSIDALLTQFGGEQAKQIAQAIAEKHGLKIEAVDDDQADLSDPEIESLKAKVRELESRQQQDNQQAQLSRQNEVDNQIRLFREAVDDAGNLLHPHFEAVENTMSRLIQAGLATDLQSAYEQAVKLEPDIHKEMLEKQRAQAVKDAEESRRKTVSEKKEAARKPGKTPAPDTEANPSTDLRETIKAAMAQHSDGV